MNAIGGFVPSDGPDRGPRHRRHRVGRPTAGPRPGSAAPSRAPTCSATSPCARPWPIALEARGHAGLLSVALGLPKARRLDRADAGPGRRDPRLPRPRALPASASSASCRPARAASSSWPACSPPRPGCSASTSRPPASPSGRARPSARCCCACATSCRPACSSSSTTCRWSWRISDRIYCLEAGVAHRRGRARTRCATTRESIASYLGTDERAIARSGPGPAGRPTIVRSAHTQPEAHHDQLARPVLHQRHRPRALGRASTRRSASSAPAAPRSRRRSRRSSSTPAGGSKLQLAQQKEPADPFDLGTALLEAVRQHPRHRGDATPRPSPPGPQVESEPERHGPVAGHDRASSATPTATWSSSSSVIRGPTTTPPTRRGSASTASTSPTSRPPSPSTSCSASRAPAGPRSRTPTRRSSSSPARAGSCSWRSRRTRTGPIRMGSMWKLYVNTDDCEALHEAAVAAGHTSLVPPMRLDRWPVTSPSSAIPTATRWSSSSVTPTEPGSEAHDPLLRLLPRHRGRDLRPRLLPRQPRAARRRGRGGSSASRSTGASTAPTWPPSTSGSSRPRPWGPRWPRTPRRRAGRRSQLHDHHAEPSSSARSSPGGREVRRGPWRPRARRP